MMYVSGELSVAKESNIIDVATVSQLWTAVIGWLRALCHSDHDPLRAGHSCRIGSYVPPVRKMQVKHAILWT